MNGWTYNPNNNTNVLMRCCWLPKHISKFFISEYFYRGRGMGPTNPPGVTALYAHTLFSTSC